MFNKKTTDVELMLAIIWQKLEKVENLAKNNGTYRSAPITTYLEELKQEMEKVKNPPPMR